MTDAEKDDAVSRYRRGQTLSHIAFALSRCPKTIKAALAERGVETVGQGRRSAKPNWGWRGA
jgi:hypothetical protein